MSIGIGASLMYSRHFRSESGKERETERVGVREKAGDVGKWEGEEQWEGEKGWKGERRERKGERRKKC